MPDYNKFTDDEIRRATPDMQDREEETESFLDGSEIFSTQEREQDTMPTQPPAKNPARAIRFYSLVFLLFLILFVVLTNCFVRVHVHNVSMEPTYYDGDIIWANRWRKPFYGCVVILVNPYYGNDERPNEPEIVLKRVLGFQGDEFWIDTDNNLWRRSGESEEIIQTAIDGLRVSGIFNFGEILHNYNEIYTVPEDCIFVLGDNFNNSEDSRYYGGVPKSSVRGVIYQ